MNLRPFFPAPSPRTPSGRNDRAARRARRQRILAWATVVALIVGVLGLGEPLEDWLRMTRALARRHPPSGQTVVVGIDDRSVEALGAWPWKRARHAQIVDRLERAGVRRIFFDVLFNAPSDRADDAAFVRAMRRSGNVYLATTTSTDRQTGERLVKLPHATFRRDSHLVSIAIRYSELAFISRLPLAARVGDAVVPSMAAAVAGVSDDPGQTFPVDYAVDVKKIRTVSVVDLLEGRFPRGSLRGKNVVIAVSSREIGDLFFLPGGGLIHGAYVMVAGAETLRSGVPTDLGWVLPFVIAVGLASVHIFTRRRWVGRSAFTVSVFGLAVLPLISESYHIWYDVIPSIVVVGAVAIARAWENFRQSYRVRGNINQVTGLPNLNALREEHDADNLIVVAAKVRNYAEITAALPQEDERAVADQIIARLKLASQNRQLYQGDDGIFVWTSPGDDIGADQFEALHVLFRSPAIVAGRSIDLDLTLGTDHVGGRALANRIGAALVAADEAAAEGRRWKAYDPAKLADADWKLSLLGRLDSAIDDGEIWVAYQPQIDLVDGRISGAEALVRWSHPEKGEISPIEFVLAAEQHNRIDRLTAFVLADAIKVAASINQRGTAFDVAVNISARLLEKPGLVAMTRRLLADAGLSPERLTLEVTESAALTSGRESIRTLEELGSLGINVSIDDYGTGFSTLEYFKRIPATEVKIDRSFVANIDSNASDRLMVRSTIELAHSLGRTVVAEGVETSAILAELTNLGCDKAQGYLIGRPMKLLNLTKLLQENQRLRA